jgi:hypothetical protein
MISVAWRTEFVSDRMSFIILIGRWGIIIVTNVHAPCEAKSDDINDGFYEELGRVVVYQCPRYNVNMKYSLHVE